MLHFLQYVIILLLLHDVGNCSTGKSAVKSRGNARVPHSSWRVVTLLVTFWHHCNRQLVHTVHVTGV